jgi:carboxyl-terminal processing protease
MKRTKDNIAQITLSSFGNNTETEFQPILADLAKNPAKAIVIDLRNNPGGFLDTAVELGGYFIEPGKPITTVKYTDRQEAYNSHGTAELAKYKIAVIVNKGSASASEILAGALQDYGLAKVVGEQSYGKGTVQELSDFSDGSTLKITVAEWLKPKGGTIDAVGITPNFIAKITDEDRKAGLDPQMEKALEVVR